jgi:membrane-associated protein
MTTALASGFWSIGVTMAGFWLRSSITGVDKYLLPIIGVIVAISLVPVAVELRKAHDEKPHEQQSDLRVPGTGEQR